MGNASSKNWSLSKAAKIRLLLATVLAVSSWNSTAAEVGLKSVFERERSTTEDVIYFRNGDELRGTVLNDVIEITTPYGDVKLNLRRCAGVSFEGARANTEAIVTVNQNRLTGIVKGRAITFKIGTSGVEISIRKEKVRCIVLKRAPDELSFVKSKPKTDLYVMSNGDLLTGKAAKPSIKIQTDYGEIPISFSEIKRVEMQGGNNMTAFIKKTNGDTIRGTLLTEEFTLNLDVGAAVEAVYKDKLTQVVVAGGPTETGTHFGVMQPVRRATGAQTRNDKLFTNSLGMKFVPVPDTPVLFCIWETRVKDYAAYASTNPGVDGSWQNTTYRKVPVSNGPDHPVVNVSWEDAKTFCRWLTQKERSAGLIGVNQSYRLPTDLEWSAAVGLNNESGSTPRERSAKVGNVYPWGTQLPPPRGAGNFLDQTAKSKFNTFLISFNWPMIKGYDDGYATTAPVGSFAANQFGLFDLSGNAWEWCEDWYDSEQTYPTLRGGAWDSRVPDVLLSSYRGNGPPGIRSGNYGFRCVLADDSAR